MQKSDILDHAKTRIFFACDKDLHWISDLFNVGNKEIW